MNVSRDIARGRGADIDYLRRSGTGPRMLLLHGVGSNSSSFGPLMAALPAGIDAVAWDAPGYGGSQPLSQPSPTPRDYAVAAERLLDALGWSRAILVGHSLGALFATSLAANVPQRIDSLVILSPALGYKVLAGDALPEGVQARVDELQALGPASFAQKRAARLVGDPQGAPDVLSAVRTAMAAVNSQGYAQAVRALGAGDLLTDAARVTCAALVAFGSADVVTPPENARAAYAALRFASGLHEVPGAGHALPQERPREIASLLADLVKTDAAA